MSELYHGNSFSRAVANDTKKGAYYTDYQHCCRIGKLLQWPENEEVAVLEPSCGDTSAVRGCLTQNKTSCKTPLFAVELDKRAAEVAKGAVREGDVVISSDFLRGVNITPGVFGFCFANPPYGTDSFTGERYERKFMEKIYALLRKDGVLALVIPYYLLQEDNFVSAMKARFETLALYRFDDKVYEQFQQCVLLLRRLPRLSYTFGKKAFTEYLETLPKPEELPYLPEEPTEEQMIGVPSAQTKDIKVFAPTIFDAAEARKALGGGPLEAIVGDRLFAKPYTANELTTPPIPPKKDILYLCAIAGAGQGFCGNAEEGNLHLQRGVVKTVTDKEVRMKGDEAEVIEKTRAAIVMTIIESDGTIHELK